ncbi:MAG TPA: hypothetical protein VHC40_05540 [Rhizomicrobium sp.]|jgi:hypothetical protein|nr:hypothetical protein [Rhizomicrobium sp.]
MAETRKKDLREGRPGAVPTTNVKEAGKEDHVMPLPQSGEDEVGPGVGSKGGMGEGQGTKSN